MHFLSDLINDGDWLSILFVAGVLGWVGQEMIESYVKLKVWGLRVALLMFVAFSLKHAFECWQPSAYDLVIAVLEGLVVGSLVLGPAWIILAGVGFSQERWNSAASYLKDRRDDSRRKSEARNRQREMERRQREQPPPTPEQDRAAQEAFARQQATKQQHKHELQRREDARVACELLYTLHEPVIKKRYPRKTFQAFVNGYLGDDKPVAVVERRASELQSLIQQHYEAVNPPERFRDLADLTAWYEKQLQLIEGLGVAEVYKRDFAVQLNERYCELTAKVMESLEP